MYEQVNFFIDEHGNVQVLHFHNKVKNVEELLSYLTLVQEHILQKAHLNQNRAPSFAWKT